MCKKSLMILCLAFNFAAYAAQEAPSSKNLRSFSDTDLKKDAAINAAFSEMSQEDFHWNMHASNPAYKVPREFQDFVSRRHTAHDYFVKQANKKYDTMLYSVKTHGTASWDMTTYIVYLGIKNHAQKQKKQIDIAAYSSFHSFALRFKKGNGKMTITHDECEIEKFQEFEHHFNALKSCQKQRVFETDADTTKFSAVWELILDPSKKTFDKNSAILFPEKQTPQKTPKMNADKADEKDSATKS